MTELQPLLDTLAAKHGWIAGTLVWIGALRVVCKWFSARLQTAIENRLALVLQSPERIDRAKQILNSRWYGALAFTLDLLISVKLPLSIPPAP